MSDESLDLAFQACLLSLRPFSLLPLRGTERLVGVVRAGPTTVRIHIAREFGTRVAFDLPLRGPPGSSEWGVGINIAAVRHLVSLTDPEQILAAATLDPYCDEALDGTRYLYKHHSELTVDQADVAFSAVAQFVRDPLYWSAANPSYRVEGFVVRDRSDVRLYVRLASETITRAFDVRLEAGPARAAIGGHEVDELLLLVGPPIDYAALQELSVGVAADPYCETAHRL